MRARIAAIAVAASVLAGSLAFAGGKPARMTHALEIAVSDSGFLDPSLRPTLLARAKELGATHVRIFIYWAKDASYADFTKAANFQVYDDLVNQALASGIQPQLTITGASYVKPTTFDEPDPVAYARFVTNVVGIFKGRVHRYSVWNEPNHPAFLKAGARGSAIPATAPLYRSLYEAGSTAIKAVDPSAEVLLGELASANAIPFLRAVAHEGTLRADGLAVHPYQYLGKPGVRSSIPARLRKGGAGISQLGDVQTLLRQLAKRGRLVVKPGAREAVPLYLTEFGYFVPDGFTSEVLPEATRAEYARLAFAQARKHGARQMLWYQLAPSPASKKDWDTSILARDLSPTPTFTALAAWLAGKK